MWILISILAIGFALYFSATQCERGTRPTNVSSGVVVYGTETLNGVQGNGFVTLDGTTVLGVVHVNGHLDAKNAKMASLSVNGNVCLTKSRVLGNSDITGFMSAVGSKFDGDIAISSKKITLDNCQATHILVRKTAWSFGSQVVELNHKSKVTGGIIFEAGDGRVLLSPDSHVGGRVIGGQIEK